MTLVYQPLVRLRDEQMVGVEALVRLTDEYGEQIPPDVFIRIAEEQGFIGQVTRRLIHTALEEIRPILTKQADFHCGLNLSAADIGACQGSCRLSRFMRPVFPAPDSATLLPAGSS
ncbi:EAL domain-containing protein, partial [Serratia ficaria]|uniref:EAL domain-containing protein n=1 Tax=Serratia ficaria TaxID=61651 RepID=UPI0036F1D126